jgi:Fe2+ transport system protein FeoA
MVKPGGRAVIREVRGGHGLMHRLAAMGLLPGREVTVVRNWGPVIVKLRHERYIVGRGMAHRIIVEPT